MRKLKAVLIGMCGIFILSGFGGAFAATTESHTKMRSVSGEIEWIDVKLGKMRLMSDAGQDTRGIAEYRINQEETRVTDATDKKFIVIKDLRAGQHVTVKLIDAPNETLVRKIIADPMTEPVTQEATGEIEALDIQEGTLIIDQEPMPGKDQRGDLVYFVFDPEKIVVMKAPSTQSVQLELSPGDLVKVDYTVKDGKRHARAITLLSAAPRPSSTTTTTTTSTTVTP